MLQRVGYTLKHPCTVGVTMFMCLSVYPPCIPKQCRMVTLVLLRKKSMQVSSTQGLAKKLRSSGTTAMPNANSTPWVTLLSRFTIWAKPSSYPCLQGPPSSRCRPSLVLSLALPPPISPPSPRLPDSLPRAPLLPSVIPHVGQETALPPPYIPPAGKYRVHGGDR